MSKQALISVVMAVFNAQNALAEAIEGILGQSFSTFMEATSDHSKRIIEDFVRKHLAFHGFQYSLAICKI